MRWTNRCGSHIIWEACVSGKLNRKVYALGGRFDKERKRWYIPAGLSLAPFQSYLRPPEPTYIEVNMRNRPTQRAQVRALGAKFDEQRGLWFVPAGCSVAPFAEWLP